MEDIIQTCCSRLNEGGRIVLNAATIENLYRANESFYTNWLSNVLLHLHKFQEASRF